MNIGNIYGVPDCERSRGRLSIYLSSGPRQITLRVAKSGAAGRAANIMQRSPVSIRGHRSDFTFQGLEMP